MIKKSKKGILRHIGIRINRDNQAMVILVTGNNNLPKKRRANRRTKKKKV